MIIFPRGYYSSLCLRPSSWEREWVMGRVYGGVYGFRIRYSQARTWFSFLFFLSFYLIIFIFTYMCIHCLCHFAAPPASGQNLFCPLVLQFCWRESIRDNKKGILFLLVWDKGSYTERFLVLLPCKTMYETYIGSSLPDLFTASWSPSRNGPRHFKITLFSPLQWAHQPHSNFRFPSLSLFLLYVFSP
jgi:hypothetical protein